MTDFTGFCHINEYRQLGYSSLSQMITLAEPLTLWSPSSVLLSRSDITVPDLKWLIEERRLRIIGRERWITDRKYRDKHPFGEDARWVPEIDGFIKKLAEEDASKPRHERRVVVAPPEDGYEWADSYMEENRAAIRRLFKVYREMPEAIPGGTVDTVKRNLQERKISQSDIGIVVKTLLRDARNHGQAFSLSDAGIAMHLSRVDLSFMQVLSDQAGLPTLVRQGREPVPLAVPVGALVLQTIEILHRLDELAGARRQNLRDFLDSSGRADLLQWMANVRNDLKLITPSELDDVVLRHLVDQLRTERFHDSVLESWRRKPWDAGPGLVGAITTIADPVLFGGVTPVGVIGFGAMVFSGTLIMLRRLGSIPADYDGPQWPFLYALGARATKRRRNRLYSWLVKRQ